MSSHIKNSVSIIIRTIPERLSLLKSALQSINQQTSVYPIEIVIVYDGAPQSTTAHEICFREGITTKYHVENNSIGRSNIANIGLELASGTLINFLDDDDQLYDNHIQTLADILANNTDLDAAYAGTDQIEREITNLNPLSTKEYRSDYFYKPIRNSLDIFNFNPFPIQSIMFKRHLLNKNTRFPPELDAMEDWLFWQRLLVGRSIKGLDVSTSKFFVPYESREGKVRTDSHLHAAPIFNRLSSEISVPVTFVQKLMNDQPIPPPRPNRALNDWSYKFHKAVKDPKLAFRYLKKQSKHAVNILTEKHRSPSHQISHSVLERHNNIFNLATELIRNESEPPNKIVVYTSVNFAYLDKAILLGESLKQHNTNIDFHILYADVIDNNIIDIFKKYTSIDRIFPMRLLDITDFKKWVFSRNVVELCTSIKPQYLDKLLNAGYEQVIYIDPDCQIFSSLDPIITSTKNHSLSLTPHCDKASFLEEQIRINELSSLAHGVFNLGYIGVNNDVTGKSVARYWKDRTNTYGFDEIERGVFTDQKFFDLAPIFFPSMEILRHMGANVASWNLDSRPISRNSEGTYFSGEDQLIFFHFSGFDQGVPETTVKALGQYSDIVKELIMNYTNKLQEIANFLPTTQPWSLSCFDNSVAIPDSFRMCYRKHSDLLSTFENPYDTSSSPNYFHWATSKGQKRISSYDRTRWLPRHY